MLEIFNTRELAFFSWLFLIFIWILLKKDCRKSLGVTLKTTVDKKLCILYLCMFLWIGLVVYALYGFNIWDLGQLKNTIIWSISYAFLALFSVNKIKEGRIYFIDAVKELFAFTVIFEIVIGFHTFSYLIEMILIPIETFLVVGVAYANRKSEYVKVKNFFNVLITLIGLVLLGYSVSWIITHFRDFATLSTFMDTIVSALLTVCYLPFLYFLMLYLRYENGFARLEFIWKDNPGLIGFAKRKAVFQFKFRVKDFQRWVNSRSFQELKTKQEIISSLQKFKQLKEIESNPSIVDPLLGWSPYKAKDFLINEGLGTRDYNHYYENEWGAGSDYLDLKDDEIIPNRIAYYVAGSQEVVTHLKLYLSISAPKMAISAQMKFVQIVKGLYREALQQAVPAELEAAIINGNDYSLVDENKKITIVKNIWPSKRGLDLDFEIQIEK